ncbi:serine/threonine-protein phosphatase 4 regulatory subunit 1-like isoform X3 [Artemia franciscana]
MNCAEVTYSFHYLGYNHNQVDYEDEGVSGDGSPSVIPTLQELQSSLATSDVFTRKSLTRTVVETFRTLYALALQSPEKDDNNHEPDLREVFAMLPIIQNLAEDSEYLVRYCMVEQMPHLSMFFSESKEYLGHLTQKFILPLLVSTLNDTNSQVRKTCHAALLVLVEQNLVEISDIDKLVCPAIFNVIQVASAEDQRAEAVTLLCRISPLLGRDITLRHFLEEYICLCNDASMQIRKICASSFGEMCSVVGGDVVEKELLLHLQRMCSDDLWGVRKACAEVFTVVASCVSMQTKWYTLSPLFVTLLRDESRWVRLAAYQNLGQFIATFHEENEKGSEMSNDESSGLLDETPDIAKQTEPAVPDLVSELVDQETTRPNEEETEDVGHPANNHQQRSDLDESVKNEILSEDLQRPPKPPPSPWSGAVLPTELTELLSGLQVEEQKEVSPTKYMFVEELSNGQLIWREPIAELEVEKELERVYKKLGEGSLVEGTIPGCDNDLFHHTNLTPLSTSPLPPQPPYTPKSQQSVCQNVIPQDLLDHYLWMVDPSHSESGDTEMARYCAFTLPAVALTLGKDHWDYLKELFKILEGDMQLLNPERRKYVLPKLREFLRLDNERNWRFRLELVEQLIAIIGYCDQNDISDHIYPLILSLLKDKVWTVRFSAVTALSSILKATHPELRTITLMDIKTEIAISQKWYLRQSYPKICEEILNSDSIGLEQFCEYAMHPALRLRWDRVPNVRIALAHLVTSKFMNNPYFSSPINQHYIELQETISLLKADEDRDVRYYFNRNDPDENAKEIFDSSKEGMNSD